VGLALLAWAVLIEPGWMVTRQTRLPIARWPAAVGPLRIAAIADLYTGARSYRRRARALLANPPPADWDGVFVAETKSPPLGDVGPRV